MKNNDSPHDTRRFGKDFLTGCLALIIIFIMVFILIPLSIFVLKLSLVLVLPIAAFILLIIFTFFFGRIINTVITVIRKNGSDTKGR